MTEEKKKESGSISRREFLKDAGLLVGGTAIGSTVLLAACGGETETVTNTATKTVTTTAQGTTTTVTTTAQGDTVTSTVIQNKYVCPYDGQEFDTLAELQAHIEAEHGGETPAVKLISLTVNGKAYEVETVPNETLQELLRQKLGFISPKDMCNGYGACGSCSVIMDGRPVLSCMTLAIQCNGAEIETAEGLADTNHPLLDAAVKHHAMQCGYCTPGFLVTSKALLDRNPNPTEEDIREILAGNICFCGTYPAHAKTILEAAQNL